MFLLTFRRVCVCVCAFVKNEIKQVEIVPCARLPIQAALQDTSFLQVCGGGELCASSSELQRIRHGRDTNQATIPWDQVSDLSRIDIYRYRSIPFIEQIAMHEHED